MTEPVRTREDLEQAVREIFTAGADPDMAPSWAKLAGFVSAALLAMGECEECERARGIEYRPEDGEVCPYCEGTGLDQARLQRGLNALEGR